MENRKSQPVSRWGLKIFAITIISLIALTQVSGILVALRGGVAGSFGIRPRSHECIGFRISPELVAKSLPEGDFEFHFLLFHFRYAVSNEFSDPQRVYCIGQDVWFGE